LLQTKLIASAIRSSAGSPKTHANAPQISHEAAITLRAFLSLS
jgi:hypothetical protein